MPHRKRLTVVAAALVDRPAATRKSAPQKIRLNSMPTARTTVNQNTH
jgi:hypothetical protein